MKIITPLILAVALSGCGAVSAWQEMEMDIQKSKAVDVLMTECQSGNMEACAHIAGHGVRR